LDIFAPRIEGITDVIYEIEDGMGKYINLKINDERRNGWL
jgi:hypothetical protein